MRYSYALHEKINKLKTTSTPDELRKLLIEIHINTTPIAICAKLFGVDEQIIIDTLKEENMYQYKKCSKCSRILPYSDFYSNPSMGGDTACGVSCQCRQCMSNNGKKYYNNNYDHKKQYSTEYKRRPDVKEKVKMYHKDYYSRPEVKQMRNKNANLAYHNDPLVRLRRILDVYINSKLKKNNTSYLEILGYSVEELKSHLESQFTPSMTWDNYGTYWEIDHEIPVSSFNLSTYDDIKVCWSLKNLRPLETTKNRQKRNNIENDELFHELQSQLTNPTQ